MINSFRKIWLDSFQIKNLPFLVLASDVFISYVRVSVSLRTIPDKSNANYRHLKKLTCKRTLRQVFICLRPPPLLGSCLGWSSNFVGSEAGQIQSVILLRR
jgi:hypothetical protein